MNDLISTPHDSSEQLATYVIGMVNSYRAMNLLSKEDQQILIQNISNAIEAYANLEFNTGFRAGAEYAKNFTDIEE